MFNPFRNGEKENFPNTEDLINYLTTKSEMGDINEENSLEADNTSFYDLNDQNDNNDLDFTIDTLSLLNPVSYIPNPTSPFKNNEIETSFFDKTLNYLKTPPEKKVSRTPLNLKNIHLNNSFKNFINKPKMITKSINTELSIPMNIEFTENDIAFTKKLEIPNKDELRKINMDNLTSEGYEEAIPTFSPIATKCKNEHQDLSFKENNEYEMITPERDQSYSLNFTQEESKPYTDEKPPMNFLSPENNEYDMYNDSMPKSSYKTPNFSPFKPNTNASPFIPNQSPFMSNSIPNVSPFFMSNASPFMKAKEDTFVLDSTFDDEKSNEYSQVDPCTPPQKRSLRRSLFIDKEDLTNNYNFLCTREDDDSFSSSPPMIIPPKPRPLSVQMERKNIRPNNFYSLGHEDGCDYDEDDSNVYRSKENRFSFSNSHKQKNFNHHNKNNQHINSNNNHINNSKYNRINHPPSKNKNIKHNTPNNSIYSEPSPKYNQNHNNSYQMNNDESYSRIEKISPRDRFLNSSNNNKRIMHKSSSHSPFDMSSISNHKQNHSSFDYKNNSHHDNRHNHHPSDVDSNDGNILSFSQRNDSFNNNRSQSNPIILKRRSSTFTPKPFSPRFQNLNFESPSLTPFSFDKRNSKNVLDKENQHPNNQQNIEMFDRFIRKNSSSEISQCIDPNEKQSNTFIFCQNCYIPNN